MRPAAATAWPAWPPAAPELHIKVGYGLNIATIVQSITHKVKHEVENATGLKVERIEVSVDDIVAD